MSGNLFSDIYTVKSVMFNGVNSAEEIEKLRVNIDTCIQERRVPDRIRYLLFKITNRCNSNCEYCPHAINRDPPEPKCDIPLEIVMRTIEEAEKMGVDAISISGGEPLIRKDIIEIIRKTVECGIVPVLLTNGLLLDRKWRSLGEAGLRYVIISIDSVNKEIYEKQRGADYEAAINGIEAALKMRDTFPGTEIHVSAVLTDDNHKDFFDLLNYMNDRQIKVQISPYHKRENDLEDYSISDIESITQLTENLIELKKKGVLIANSEGFLCHLPDFFCNDKVMPDNFVCKTGYTTLAIDTYMNVKPCWSYEFKPVANLEHTSLPEIWNSKELQYYRERMLNCECEGCWYLCTSETCMLLENQL